MRHGSVVGCGPWLWKVNVCVLLWGVCWIELLLFVMSMNWVGNKCHIACINITK